MEYYEALVGDGESTIFYFTFPFFGVNDIHIKIDDIEQPTDKYIMTPNPTPNDADTEYTGGRIEFITPPALDAKIVIYREIELVRHIDYQPTQKPESHQMNQDANQLMGALRELKINLKNTLGLASIPTLADLLTELTTICDSIPNFLTDDDLAEINDAIATKANKDADNLTQIGKTNIINCLIPDYNASINIKTHTSASNKFIAPQNGIVYGDTANNAVLYMNDVIIKGASSTGYGGVSFCFTIAAGDSFYGGFANIAQFAPFKNA